MNHTTEMSRGNRGRGLLCILTASRNLYRHFTATNVSQLAPPNRWPAFYCYLLTVGSLIDFLKVCLFNDAVNYRHRKWSIKNGLGACFHYWAALAPTDVWRENRYAEERYTQWLGLQSFEFILLTDHLKQNGNDVNHLLPHLTFLNFSRRVYLRIMYNCFNKQQLFSQTVLIGWFCKTEATGDVR